MKNRTVNGLEHLIFKRQISLKNPQNYVFVLDNRGLFDYYYTEGVAYTSSYSSIIKIWSSSHYEIEEEAKLKSFYNQKQGWSSFV